MATYNDTELKEQPIYGSSRLGMYRGGTEAGKRMLGNKNYELTNHLGNVLAVVGDKKYFNDGLAGGSMVTPPAGATPPATLWAYNSNAEVHGTNDYYPFGLDMAVRSMSSSSYRYGFNGKEKDPATEWASGVHYDYGFRIYDPRIARFLSVDPLTKSYPMLTPYQFASNSPISGIDKDGAEWEYFMKDYFHKVWGFDHTKNKDSEYVKQFMTQKSIEFGDHVKHQAKENIRKTTESPLMMGLLTLTAAPFVFEFGAVSSTPTFASMAKTAATNSAINFSAQFVTNGFNIREVDFADVAVSGVTSLIPGGKFLGGKINPTKIGADALLSSAFDVKISGTATVFDEKSGKDFLVDFSAGIAMGTLGEYSDDIVKGFTDSRFTDFLDNISDDNLRAIFKGAGKEGTTKVLQEAVKTFEGFVGNKATNKLKEDKK